jgi:hypothetical protein
MKLHIAGFLGALLVGAIASGSDKLVQARQTFDDDPGWEGVNNRVAGENLPTIRQDVGWTGKGEIGGVVSRTRTPAYYAMKVPTPLSMAMAMSASGKIRVVPRGVIGGAYFGFFNAARQEWRPWSSMAVRIADAGGAQPLQPALVFDYMTGGWKAGGYDATVVPADDPPRREVRDGLSR